MAVVNSTINFNLNLDNSNAVKSIKTIESNVNTLVSSFVDVNKQTIELNKSLKSVNSSIDDISEFPNIKSQISNLDKSVVNFNSNLKILSDNIDFAAKNFDMIAKSDIISDESKRDITEISQKLKSLKSEINSPIELNLDSNSISEIKSNLSGAAGSIAKFKSNLTEIKSEISGIDSVATNNIVNYELRVDDSDAQKLKDNLSGIDNLDIDLDIQGKSKIDKVLEEIEEYSPEIELEIDGVTFVKQVSDLRKILESKLKDVELDVKSKNNLQNLISEAKRTEKQVKKLEDEISEFSTESSKNIKSFEKNTKKSLDNSGESFKSFSNDVSQAFSGGLNLNSFSDLLTNTLGGSKLLAGVGLVGLGASAVSTAININDSVNALRNLQREIQGLTGLTGDELSEITTRVKTIEETYGLGAERITLAARNLAATQNLSLDRALELVESGIQRGFNDEGLEQLQEYSTFLKQVGLDAEESIAFVQQSNQAGFYNDKGIDALKEATISLGELTKSSRDALAPLGDEFTENLFSSLNDPQNQRSLFEVIQEVSSRAFEKGLNRQEIGTLIADVFRGAGEDAGGAEVLKFFAEIDRAALNLDGTLSQLQQKRADEAAANQRINESYQRISEALLSTGGSVSTLSLRFKEFVLGIVEDLIPVINDFLDVFSSIFEAFLDFAQFLRTSRIGSIIKNITIAITAYVVGMKAAALATKLFAAASVRLKGAFTSMRGALRSATTGVKSFNRALSTNAIGLFIAAVAVLIENWDTLTRAITGATNAQIRFNQQQSSLNASIAKTKVEIQAQVQTIQDGNKSINERQKALNELVDNSPEIVRELKAQGVIIEGARVGQDSGVIDRFIKEIENNTAALAQNRVVEGASSDFGVKFFEKFLREIEFEEGVVDGPQKLTKEIKNLVNAQKELTALNKANVGDDQIEKQTDKIDEIQQNIDDLLAGETKFLGLTVSPGRDDIRIQKLVDAIARREAAGDIGTATVNVSRPEQSFGARPLAASGARSSISKELKEPFEIEIEADLQPFLDEVENAKIETKSALSQIEIDKKTFQYELDLVLNPVTENVSQILSQNIQFEDASNVLESEISESYKNLEKLRKDREEKLKTDYETQKDRILDTAKNSEQIKESVAKISTEYNNQILDAYEKFKELSADANDIEKVKLFENFSEQKSELESLREAEIKKIEDTAKLSANMANKNRELEIKYQQELTSIEKSSIETKFALEESFAAKRQQLLIEQEQQRILLLARSVKEQEERLSQSYNEIARSQIDFATNISKNLNLDNESQILEYELSVNVSEIEQNLDMELESINNSIREFSESQLGIQIPVSLSSQESAEFIKNKLTVLKSDLTNEAKILTEEEIQLRQSRIAFLENLLDNRNNVISKSNLELANTERRFQEEMNKIRDEGIEKQRKQFDEQVDIYMGVVNDVKRVVEENNKLTNDLLNNEAFFGSSNSVISGSQARIIGLRSLATSLLDATDLIKDSFDGFKEINRDIQDLNLELSDNRENLKSINDTIEQKEKEFRTSSEKRREVLKKDLDFLRKQKQEVELSIKSIIGNRDEINRQINENNERIAELNKIIADPKGVNSIKENAKQELNILKEQTANRNAEYKKQKKNIEQNIKNIEKSLNDSSLSSEERQLKLINLEELKAQKKEIESEMSDLNKTFKLKKDELKATIDDPLNEDVLREQIKSNISATKDGIEQLKNEFENSESEISNKIQTLEFLMENTTMPDAQREAMRATVQALKEERAALKDEYDKAIQDKKDFLNEQKEVLKDPAGKEAAKEGAEAEKEELKKGNKELEKDLKESASKLSELSRKKWEEILKESLKVAEILNQAIFDALKKSSQATIDSLDAVIENQKDKIDDVRGALKEGGDAAKNYTAEQLEIEEARLQKLEEQRAREIQRQKDFTAAQIALQGAIAIAKTFATLGFPAAIPAAAVLTASLILQIAALRSQANSATAQAKEGAVIEGGKIKQRGKYNGGTLSGRRHSNGGILIEAEDGEDIMSRPVTKEFRDVLDLMHEGKIKRSDIKLSDEIVSKPKFQVNEVLQNLTLTAGGFQHTKEYFKFVETVSRKIDKNVNNNEQLVKEMRELRYDFQKSLNRPFNNYMDGKKVSSAVSKRQKKINLIKNRAKS